MTKGELLTRATIWITLVGYAAGTVIFARSRKRRKWDSVARLAWTAACIGLLAHVAFAFHFYHRWSHTAAYSDTARQTDDVFGLNWGGGLYVNYALLIGWIMDVSWWWIRGLEAYRRRPWPLVVTWHAFLIFVVFNATVIFETGYMRWMGLLVCSGLCIVWLVAARDNSTRTPGKYPLTVAEE